MEKMHFSVLSHLGRGSIVPESYRKVMIVNKNQLGRHLLQRLVDETKVDMQVAMRFFYNSDFYASVPDGPVNGDIETLYSRFKHEFECAE